MSTDRPVRRGVVVIDAAVPDPERSAGERAVVDQLDGLVALGEAVTFVGLGPASGDSGTVAEAVRARGVVVHDAGGPVAVQSVLDRGDADVVMVHRPGPALAVAGILTERPAVATAYVGHDLHGDRQADQARHASVVAPVDERAQRLTAAAERAAWDRYDVTVLPTTAEAELVTARVGRPVAHAAPYYRGTPADLTRGPGPHGRRGLLMVGGAAHAPNADALHHVVTSVLPALRAVGVAEPVTVVGEWPAATRNAIAAGPDDGISWTGRVDEATLHALHHDHRLLLAPVRFGAGAKRKLVAAMGLGCPVVTTGVGARGLLVRDATAADGVLVADDPADLAAAVARLHDPAVWSDATTRAHAAVDAVYGQQSYDRHLADLLARLRARRVQPG